MFYLYPGRFPVGQNLVQNHVNWQASILAWQIENLVYSYGVADQDYNAIGHYTQVKLSINKLYPRKIVIHHCIKSNHQVIIGPSLIFL